MLFSQRRKSRFQEENKVQIARLQTSACSTADWKKVRGSGCGGDGKTLKMFEQKYDMVWTTWHLILYPEPQNPRAVRDSEGQCYTRQGSCGSAPYWCSVGQC